MGTLLDRTGRIGGRNNNCWSPCTPAVQTYLRATPATLYVRGGAACTQMDVAAPGAVEAIAGQLREVLRAAAAGASAAGGLPPERAPDVALSLVSSEAQVSVPRLSPFIKSQQPSKSACHQPAALCAAGVSHKQRGGSQIKHVGELHSGSGIC